MTNTRPRAQDLGLEIGIMPRGPHNSITDVPEVTVGHVTLIDGNGPLAIGKGPVRTGVTVIMPHGENVFQRKVTGAVHVINGFGKALGFLQVAELGVIESPIPLTSTLSIWRAADALVDWATGQMKGVFSFNALVGECNDSFLNDIIGRHVRSEHVLQAIREARTANSDEGNVGAGTGMTGFGWKGGIGTASRLCEMGKARYTLGVTTLTNTGDPRELRMDGVRIGRRLLPPKSDFDPSKPGGSIIIVVGTDAPVDARQMGRIARRTALGLARAGGIADHGSGDFVIAFSNARATHGIDDAELNPLFRAAVEATEEAVINSVLRAETLVGRDGNTRHGIPIDEVRKALAAGR
ncbi:MAG: P1 family peptidase [SAR202 cluster bacterium]|nr:P1 family peptidase [SAR202 cluster bacterium]